jgi:hypothetical protein
MMAGHHSAARVRHLGMPTFSKRLEQQRLGMPEEAMKERAAREREWGARIVRGRQRTSTPVATR